ncbi:stimulated by retinoic acid gene 8 protein-like [Acipenser oxyrinchus oxyrinchus]|uniref:Stimulated by retinoic acid gene 8 protein-like n=1 Tax=Acipenser oxyrinchus oxyrinchus TaxID=40147 RepID=A0AAD8DDC0_ACIOX|nr:stimulated by retinoic acid gene 8 protein-like [Acipenser oxyrinchus oxyrinchus]
MEGSASGSSPLRSGCDGGSCGAHLQLEDPQRERRRLLQARHRATLAGLFDNLREVVCPITNKAPTKWQVLRRAASYMQQQERRLSRLLRLKEVFQLDDGGPCSLEEVRQEYMSLYSDCSPKSTVKLVIEKGSATADLLRNDDREILDSNGDVTPSQSPISSPSIIEFEGYLYFYKQTLDLLVRKGVLTPEQTDLPVVSEAISGLWGTLPGDRKAVFQSCSQEQAPSTWQNSNMALPHCEGQLDSAEIKSQGASGSSGSTFEEELLQDAYDVVQKEMASVSGDSPVFGSRNRKTIGELTELYRQILGFVKSRLHMEPDVSQELSLYVDYETVFLRCTETFDDEDL